MHILKPAPLSFNVAFRANVMEMILQLFIYHNVTWDIFNEAISKQAIVCIKYRSLYCIILAKYFLVYQVILLKIFKITRIASISQKEWIVYVIDTSYFLTFMPCPLIFLRKVKSLRHYLNLTQKNTSKCDILFGC